MFKKTASCAALRESIFLHALSNLAQFYFSYVRLREVADMAKRKAMKKLRKRTEEQLHSPHLTLRGTGVRLNFLIDVAAESQSKVEDVRKYRYSIIW